MTIWAVELEAEGAGTEPDDATLDEFMALLAEGDAAGSASAPTRDRGARYSATLWFDTGTEDPIEVASAARHMFHLAAKDVGLPDWPIVRIEVMTEAAFDADLASRALPPLLGVSELGDLLGVSRQRASIVAKSPTFPRPVAVLQAGPVWTEPSVRRFIDDWERKPGRPRRRATQSA